MGRRTGSWDLLRNGRRLTQLSDLSTLGRDVLIVNHRLDGHQQHTSRKCRAFIAENQTSTNRFFINSLPLRQILEWRNPLYNEGIGSTRVNFWKRSPLELPVRSRAR